jgi:hypothetical protein
MECGSKACVVALVEEVEGDGGGEGKYRVALRQRLPVRVKTLVLRIERTVQSDVDLGA